MSRTTAIVRLAALMLAVACVAAGGAVEGAAASSRLGDEFDGWIEQRRRVAEALAAGGSLAPERLAAMYGALARTYLLRADLAAARAHFDRAADLAPGDFRWAHYLGVVAARMEDRAAAVRRFTSSSELAPWFEPSREWLSRLEGDGVVDAPTHATSDPLIDGLAAFGRRLRVEFAQDKLETGDVDGALAELETVLTFDPGDSRARYQLAVAQFRAGRAAEALANVRRVVEEEPDFGEAHFSLASVLAARGERDEALLHFRHAFAADRGNSAVHERLASELAARGEVEESVALYSTLVAREPHRVGAVRDYASLLAGAGRAEEAVRQLRRSVEAVSAAEARAVLLLDAGRIGDAAGHGDAAIADLEQVVALVPRQATGHAELAAALARSGRFDEAAESYGRWIEIEPESVTPWFSRALALLLAGRDAPARETLEAALDRLPGETSLTHLLARLLATSEDAAVRDGARALILARSVLAGASSPEHAETVAMALAETGSFDEAVRWQERIVETLGGAESPAASAAAGRLELYRRGEAARSPWAPPATSTGAAGR